MRIDVLPCSLRDRSADHRRSSSADLLGSANHCSSLGGADLGADGGADHRTLDGATATDRAPVGVSAVRTTLANCGGHCRLVPMS